MSIILYLISLANKIIGDILKPTTGIPRIVPLDIDNTTKAVLEPSVITEIDGLKVYFTRSIGDSNHKIYLGRGETALGDWIYNTDPVIGMGYGGAPLDRQAHSSVVFKKDSTYYCFATNGYGFGEPGEDRNVYLYKSLDGVAFTDLGLILDKTLIPSASGFGNTSVYPEKINGKYEMLVEAFVDGIWRIYRLQSNEIESGWVYVNAIPSLQVNNTGMYGGMQHTYINNKWHIFYHYGTQVGNLPTVIGYATSIDLIDVTLKETPMLGIEYPVYGALTDQLADPWMFEFKSKSYMLAEYCKNTGGFESETWIWEYDGTLNSILK